MSETPVYKSSSQYRNWFWQASPNQLETLRLEMHESACKRINKQYEQERQLGASVTTPELLTLQEHETLVNYYLQLFATAATTYGMSNRTRLTAMTFFKRFYLKKSVMEYEPKLLLLVSLFLASKVENHPVNLDKLLQKTPNAPKKSDLVPLEIILCDAIGYDFKVKHVDTALDGAWFTLSQQTSLDPSLLTLAENYAMESYQTDALLLYWPSTIAWSCLALAKVPLSSPAPSSTQLSSCITYLEKHGISKNGLELVSKAFAKSCADKLSKIKLPENDPESLISRKRKREEEEVKSHRVKIKLVNNDVFS